MNKDKLSYKEFYEKLEDIHRDITDIKVQTTRTNGRVTACEAFNAEIKNEIKLIKGKMWEMSLKVAAGTVIIIAILYIITGQVFTLF